MNITSREGESEQLSQLLVAIGRDRDVAAFGRLFTLLVPRIRGVVGRGSDGAGEEVVQETFVNIWKKAHLFDAGKASATTWIYAVARNVKIDIARKTTRRTLDIEDPSFAGDAVPTPHEHFSAAEDRRHLERAMSTLPQEQREILHLAYFAGKAHSEIAMDLRLPLGTVKSRIRLALERLREELGGHIR